jgi:hypothetical protein
MGVGVAEGFAGEFAGGVGGDGACGGDVFLEGHGESEAVDGAGGDEGEFADAGKARGFEDGGGALDVDINGSGGFADGEANAGESGEVEDGFGAVVAEGADQEGGVADIANDEG